MLKRIITVVMCLVVVLSLTSCGGNNIASVNGENIHKGYFEYYFNQQYSDKYYDTFRNTLTVLNLEYCVETEKLRVIFKENIKDIITKEEDIDKE